jgi:hypothetical protein
MITTTECAMQYVGQYFPAARCVILAGSAETALATATSDLDIVIINEAGSPVLRRTDVHAGRVIEAFVHTPTSVHEFLQREVPRRRSPLLHMCAQGRILVDPAGFGAALQMECRRRLADGPPPLSDAEDEDRRYAITDLLDDLAGCRDPAELVFIATRLLPLLAELVLLQDRQWISSGKWLLRRLSAWSPELAAVLVDSYRRSIVEHDPGPFLDAAAALVEERGGRVQAGYVRVAHG